MRDALPRPANADPDLGSVEPEQRSALATSTPRYGARSGFLPRTAVSFADGGRGLHSSTSLLNLSALYGIGGARRGCVSRVQGVLGGVQGVQGVFLFQIGSRRAEKWTSVSPWLVARSLRSTSRSIPLGWAS